MKIGTDKCPPIDVAAWNRAISVHGADWCIFVMGTLDIVSPKALIVEAEIQKLKLPPVPAEDQESRQKKWLLEARERWRALIKQYGDQDQAAAKVRSGLERLRSNVDRGWKGGDPAMCGVPAEDFLAKVQVDAGSELAGL